VHCSQPRRSCNLQRLLGLQTRIFRRVALRTASSPTSDIQTKPFSTRFQVLLTFSPPSSYGQRSSNKVDFKTWRRKEWLYVISWSLVTGSVGCSEVNQILFRVCTYSTLEVTRNRSVSFNIINGHKAVPLESKSVKTPNYTET